MPDPKDEKPDDAAALETKARLEAVDVAGAPVPPAAAPETPASPDPAEKAREARAAGQAGGAGNA